MGIPVYPSTFPQWFCFFVDHIRNSFFFLVVCFASAVLLVSLKIALNFFLRMKPKPKPKNLNQMPKRYDSQSVTMQVVECEIGLLYILWKCKRNVEGVI